MSQTKRQVAGVRKSAGIKRGKAKLKSASHSSLRPKTHVAVLEGFNNILSANDNAVKITYTR